MNENELNGEKLTPQQAYEAYNRGEMNEADFEAITGEKAPESPVSHMIDTAIGLGGDVVNSGDIVNSTEDKK